MTADGAVAWRALANVAALLRVLRRMLGSDQQADVGAAKRGLPDTAMHRRRADRQVCTGAAGGSCLTVYIDWPAGQIPVGWMAPGGARVETLGKHSQNRCDRS